MSKSTPTLVVTDTDRLSAAADAIAELINDPKITKNSILNKISRKLLEKNLNWGGLKAMTSPVIATAMDAGSDAFSPPQHQEIEPDVFRLEHGKLVFFIPHHENVGGHPFPINIDEVPALKEALFGSNAPVEYTTGDLTLTPNPGNRVLISARHYDGVMGEIMIEAADLSNFLDRNEPHLRLLVVEDRRMGEHVYDAFMNIAKNGGEGETLLTEAASGHASIEMDIEMNGNDAIQSRIENACRNATWDFLAHAAEHGERRTAIRRNDWQDVVNAIFHYEVSSLTDAIYDLVDKEHATNSQ